MKEQEKNIRTEKRKKDSWDHYVKMGVTAFVTVAACITFFFVLYRFDAIAGLLSKIMKSAESIIIGLALAYLLMPTKNFIEKRIYRLLRNKRFKKDKAKEIAKFVAITGAIIFLFIIIGVLIAILVPALITSIFGLVEAMPGYIDSFVAWIEEIGLADSSVALMIGETITSLTSELQTWAKNEILPLVQEYLGQITSGVLAVLKAILNFIIGIVVVVYVMTIQETLTGQCKKIVYAIFPAKEGNIIIDTVRKSHEIFGGFVTGKIIDSAIIGVIAYIGCMILQIPSALLVSFIIGVTNVIPFFGPFIGAVPTILLVLIQSPIHALYLAIFILVLQQVDGNIIGPKILGDSTGLSAFWILTSISIAGGLFGFFGMLLGVPVFAVIYYIVQQIVKYRMEKKNLSSDTEEYVTLVSIDEGSKEMKYAPSTEENDTADA
ncbi:MAG: AI-2E family transporter [Agathobacter sp.]|nr:AI-2E family transporter [Agathobacter sp.]